MLAAPEPDDPQDGVVANEYKTDYEKWKRTEQYDSEICNKETLSPLPEDLSHRSLAPAVEDFTEVLAELTATSSDLIQVPSHLLFGR